MFHNLLKCVICEEGKATITVAPCNHQYMCANCLCQLIDKNLKASLNCAICRQKIEGVSFASREETDDSEDHSLTRNNERKKWGLVIFVCAFVLLKEFHELFQ